MATRVKRLAVGVVALAALGALGAGSAAAQTATTTTSTTTSTVPPLPPQPPVTATFASPVSAPAGQPIWIRSITPCPVPKAGTTSWVEAQLLAAVDLADGDKVWGHVRDNGDWDITLPAPPGPSGGATGRYLIQVQCGTSGQPPVDDEAIQIITRKYISRTLVVTSGTATGADWIDGPVGGVATTTTTTTTAPPATTTTVAGGGSQPPGFNAGASVVETTAGGGVPTKSSYTSASQVQAEIVKKAATAESRRALAASQDDTVSLNASPASAARNQESSDGGIPPWSFACAAALAVGAVVAWGQRRSAPVELRSAPVDVEIDE